MQKFGILYLFIAIFLLASNFTVGVFGRSIPPWEMAFFRFLLALIMLLPFGYSSLKKDWYELKRSWHLLLIYSILGIAIPGGFAYISLRETSAINGAFIFASTPIFTLIFAWVLLKEKLNLIQTLGLFITL